MEENSEFNNQEKLEKDYKDFNLRIYLEKYFRKLEEDKEKEKRKKKEKEKNKENENDKEEKGKK